MDNLQLFNVAPSIPERIRFVEELARNLWWCWNMDAIELFRRIDPRLWKENRSNPLRYLNGLSQQRLKQISEDDGFIAHMNQVKDKFDNEVVKPCEASDLKHSQELIAYFSLEYGIHESVSMYSGGLGVLAGDHLKAASDLGLPLVAVGLLYRQGYFTQQLTQDGWQQERYPDINIQQMPLTRLLDENDKPVYISLPFPDGRITATIWRMDVGRIPLYLLDTNIPQNPEKYRQVTAQLYGGDRKMRLEQELLLGIGGFRALIKAGYDPAVCHMNEGHSAFLGLGRIEHLVKNNNFSMDAVDEIIPRSNVFTTHTPVPAGNEAFKTDLLRPYLDALEPEIGLNADYTISKGGQPHGYSQDEVSMTVLGLNIAWRRNGVSKLHGEVSRNMWKGLWPTTPRDEITIGHITNGVHSTSWVSPDNHAIFNRYLGSDWHNAPSSPTLADRIADIPDEELWRSRELGRSRLIRTARAMAVSQHKSRNACRKDIMDAKSILDQDTLTIGFARRFATYKRAILILRDRERLTKLLTNRERPIQLIFAGRAHPADNAGKEFIKEVIHFSFTPEVRKNIIFLEDYDINIARRMVQGVDVWLNTPRRPREASGTSGMKAAMNGVLNLSILDGWWAEADYTNAGWAIGTGEEYADQEYADNIEALSMYNILENEVIPTFYDRPAGDIPTHWTQMMKSAILLALRDFSSQRMVAQYNREYYIPTAKNYRDVIANNARKAMELAAHRKRLETIWSKVSIAVPQTDREISSLHVGDQFTVSVKVNLGELSPDEVDMEVYYGQVDPNNAIKQSCADKMQVEQDLGSGVYIYKQTISCQRAGRYGFSARLTPAGNDWQPAIPGFVKWAEPDKASENGKKAAS
ncbi:alpha-glucan phosphorylase [bacterium E08(2017)]|nr:alpha-glucan phosphorylase [bacterium E08(2017)]